MEKAFRFPRDASKPYLGRNAVVLAVVEVTKSVHMLSSCILMSEVVTAYQIRCFWEVGTSGGHRSAWKHTDSVKCETAELFLCPAEHCPSLVLVLEASVLIRELHRTQHATLVKQIKCNCIHINNLR